MAKRENKPWHILLLAAIAAAFVMAIVFFKSTTKNTLDPSAPSPTAKPRVAVPDTTVAAGTLPPIADTIRAAQPDSIGSDPRPAEEAGEEDGYWDGYYDGIAGRHADKHDVASRFPSPKERAAYAAAYVEGYERGYAEGARRETETAGQ